jgi:hypothetical protein
MLSHVPGHDISRGFHPGNVLAGPLSFSCVSADLCFSYFLPTEGAVARCSRAGNNNSRLSRDFFWSYASDNSSGFSVSRTVSMVRELCSFSASSPFSGVIFSRMTPAIRYCYDLLASSDSAGISFVIFTIGRSYGYFCLTNGKVFVLLSFTTQAREHRHGIVFIIYLYILILYL